MRVLEAIQRVDHQIGGPCRAVLDLSEVLAARGHTVTILAASGPDIPSEWIASDSCAGNHVPRVYLCPEYRWPLPSSSFTKLARRLVAEADVVHLHGVWEPFNLVVAAIARRCGVPYVVTLRGMLDDWSMLRSNWKKRLYLASGGRSMLEHAAFVQCTAEAELAQSRRWFPGGHGRVVPNLLNLAAFDAPGDGSAAIARFPELARYPVILLFLGRVSPKKGVEHLLDAVGRLHEQGVEVGAAIAGEAADRSYAEMLQSQAARLGIKAHVHFLGHVGGPLKVSLLRAATLLVIPTSQENFGFVFFESLAAGTPVVTTNLVDTAEELRQSGGGFLVPQSGEAIAECVGDLISSGDALQTAGRRGKAWVFRELATAHVAARYEHMFVDAINQARAVS
jgi:glycosyltransferase involved in cell wall biosynthesis